MAEGCCANWMEVGWAASASNKGTHPDDTALRLPFGCRTWGHTTRAITATVQSEAVHQTCHLEVYDGGFPKQHSWILLSALRPDAHESRIPANGLPSPFFAYPGPHLTSILFTILPSMASKRGSSTVSRAPCSSWAAATAAALWSGAEAAEAADSEAWLLPGGAGPPPVLLRPTMWPSPCCDAVAAVAAATPVTMSACCCWRVRSSAPPKWWGLLRVPSKGCVLFATWTVGDVSCGARAQVRVLPGGCWLVGPKPRVVAAFSMLLFTQTCCRNPLQVLLLDAWTRAHEGSTA